MKLRIYLIAALGIPAWGAAQTPVTPSDQNLINLQTPSLLQVDHSSAALDLRYFGGYDKTLHGSLALGYGIYKDFELDLAGSFEKWNSVGLGGGTSIRFGGTDEELSLKYRVPGMVSFPISVQAGVAYVQTPAQDDRVAGTLAGSIGYSPDSKVRFYLNPKAVFLDRNSLFGLGVGGAVDIVPKISLIGDWTPMLAGENTVNTQTGFRSRAQLYSVGLRFPNLVMNGTLDFGVTNSTGLTTGSSLTPSLGNSPALYARFSYRF